MKQPFDLTSLAGATLPGAQFDVTVERAEADRLYVTLQVGAISLSGCLKLTPTLTQPARPQPHTCTNCGKPFFGPVCDACGELWACPIVPDFNAQQPACPECGHTALTLTGKQVWRTVENWADGDCLEADTRESYGWLGWVVGQCEQCGHQFAFQTTDRLTDTGGAE